MEFNEKLQELRKQKGITQEELGEKLYVSRTAISKWESGRGYPNIESLKAIAKFFSVTVDQLLSTDEALTIAEEDVSYREKRFRDLIYGLLDISIAMLLFLPLFASRVDGMVREVSLFALQTVSLWLKTAYFIAIFGTVAVGGGTLTLQNCQSAVWLKIKTKLSLLLGLATVLLFMISLQAYAAIFVFVLLVIKALMLIKLQ